MFANGLDVRKDLLASTIANVIKHYTLPNHSLMSVEAAKRLSVDWMPSIDTYAQMVVRNAGRQTRSIPEKRTLPNAHEHSLWTSVFSQVHVLVIIA